MSDVVEDEPELTVWDARRKRLYKEAVRETLVEFGLNPTEPLAIQQDMAWLRKRRVLEESAFAKFVGVLITLITPGAVAAFVASFLSQR